MAIPKKVVSISNISPPMQQCAAKWGIYHEPDAFFWFPDIKKGTLDISGPSKVLAKPGGNTESHVPKIQ